MIKNINLEVLKNFINSYGALAWLVYILTFIILPIFLFPVPILAICGGILFNFWLGSLLTIVGAMINILTMYYIAIFFSKDYISAKISKFQNREMIKSLQNNKNQFLLILVLRLIPFVPYNALNYAAGFFKVNLFSYLFSSIIGIIPATFILINVGKNSLHYKSNDFIISIILLILLCVIPIFIKKYLKRKKWL